VYVVPSSPPESWATSSTVLLAAQLPMSRRSTDATPAPVPVLATGTFVSDAHETVGRVSVQRTESSTVLRPEGFSTSNGPDVRVYLVAVDSNAGSTTVKRGETIDLGALKGHVGDQNYVVPAVLGRTGA
jgi:Electron transfer DM13